MTINYRELGDAVSSLPILGQSSSQSGKLASELRDGRLGNNGDPGALLEKMLEGGRVEAAALVTLAMQRTGAAGPTVLQAGHYEPFTKSIAGDVVVDGDFSAEGDFLVAGTFHVKGNLEGRGRVIAQRLVVDGETKVARDVLARDSVSFGGQSEIDGSVAVIDGTVSAKSLRVGGRLTATDDIRIEGPLRASEVAGYGSLRVGSDAMVYGSTTVRREILVGKDLWCENSISAGGRIEAGGDVHSTCGDVKSMDDIKAKTVVAGYTQVPLIPELPRFSDPAHGIESLGALDASRGIHCTGMVSAKSIKSDGPEGAITARGIQSLGDVTAATIRSHSLNAIGQVHGQDIQITEDLVAGGRVDCGGTLKAKTVIAESVDALEMDVPTLILGGKPIRLPSLLDEPVPPQIDHGLPAPGMH